MTDRSHPADGLAGVPAHEVRRCRGDRLHAEEFGHLPLVHAVCSAGEDQQRLLADREDKAVGDRPDRDAELRGSGGRRADLRGEHAQLGGGAGLGEEPGDLGHPRVRGCGHAADPATGAGALPTRSGAVDASS
jgi:hypothetical protein